MVEAEQFDPYHVRMKIGKQWLTGNFSEDLAIPDDPESLVQEIQRQPAMYYYWSSMAEVARGQHERAKGEFERWYADKYSEARKLVVEEIGKSYVTDTLIKAKVFELWGPEYDERYETVLSAEYFKNTMNIAAKSFLEKSSSMINILSWRKANLQEAGRA